MKGTKLAIGCLGVFLVAILAWHSYTRLLRNPPFSMDAVALPAELFPADFIYNQMTRISEGMPGVQSGGQGIYWSGGDGLAVYNVHRFLTKRGVDKWFQRSVNSRVNDGFDSHRLSRIPAADRYFTGCGNSEFGGFRCVYIATYDGYLVFLNVVIDDKMPIDQFEQIVFAVDERFVAAFRSAD